MEKKIILLASLLMFGCSTTSKVEDVKKPVEPIKVIQNEKKDAYIEKIEEEAAEASAALSVVHPRIAEPSAKIVGVAINRLNSIKRPTQEQIKKWTEFAKSDKAIDEQSVKASKLEEELNDAYLQVAVADAEAFALSKQVETMENQRQAEIKAESYEDIRDACIWLGSILTLAGVALGVVGFWLGRGFAVGGTVLAVGVSIIAAPLVIQDIVEAWWFKWTVGGTFVITAAYGLWRLFKDEKEVRCKVKSSSYNGESS